MFCYKEYQEIQPGSISFFFNYIALVSQPQRTDIQFIMKQITIPEDSACISKPVIGYFCQAMYIWLLHYLKQVFKLCKNPRAAKFSRQMQP